MNKKPSTKRKTASSNSIKINIDVTDNNKKSNLTLSEIGALSTAANRAINEIAAQGLSIETRERYIYSPQGQEPHLVKVEVTDIRQGSLIIEGLTEAGNFISANSTSFYVGVASSAAFKGIEILSKHMKQAAKRLKPKSNIALIERQNNRIDPSFNQEKNTSNTPAFESPPGARIISVKIQIGKETISSEVTVRIEE